MGSVARQYKHQDVRDLVEITLDRLRVAGLNVRKDPTTEENTKERSSYRETWLLHTLILRRPDGNVRAPQRVVRQGSASVSQATYK